MNLFECLLCNKLLENQTDAERHFSLHLHPIAAPPSIDIQPAIVMAAIGDVQAGGVPANNAGLHNSYLTDMISNQLVLQASQTQLEIQMLQSQAQQMEAQLASQVQMNPGLTQPTQPLSMFPKQNTVAQRILCGAWSNRLITVCYKWV